jgi:transcription elongation factor GreA
VSSVDAESRVTGGDRERQSMEMLAVTVGSRVRIRDDDGEAEFELAGELADPFAGSVSVDSPLGRALLGHHPGDRVRFQAPGGLMLVVVVAVV